MLVGRESDGFPVFQEDFLRQAIKEFPYKESTLFKALVRRHYTYSTVGKSRESSSSSVLPPFR